ncbi:MAG: DUF4831 family protein [Odoribacteraceae bacterium]|jgi:hypothetical protein|nr:DUF4831 family protein [Odoribacteraceae bacterium]
MKRFFVFLLLAVAVFPAAGQRGKAVNAPVSMSYLLPRAVFNVEVTLECSEWTPGPVGEYAERQLGTRPPGNAPEERWRVKGVRVTPVAVPDDRRVFSVNAAGEYGGVLLSLSPEGFLAGAGVAGGKDSPRVIEYAASEATGGGEIEYFRFGIESTLKEVLDSNFSTLVMDGVERRVWDPIERYVLKEREEYVQEVTDAIFDIRRKRLAALTSPGGITGESLRALEALEADYVSLFLGRRVAREERRVFAFDPVKEGEGAVLFRLSERRGVTGKDDVSGVPYLAEVAGAVVPGRREVAAAGGREATTGLAYCVPAVGVLRVFRGESTLFEGRCVVPQLGEVRHFPLEVIGGEGISIEFYPSLGSIKSVTRGK